MTRCVLDTQIDRHCKVIQKRHAHVRKEIIRSLSTLIIQT